MSEFKDIIKAIRNETGLSQKDFSTRVGMKPAAYNMIESGKNQPSYLLLHTIVSIFNLDANKLFSKSLDDKIVFLKYDTSNELSEADFLNEAQVRSKRVNFLYQSLIDIRLLLFQELNIKGDFATKAEADLLNTLARPSILDDEFKYPYNDLDKKGKIEYLRKIDSCITLFTNTFFECFHQLYDGTRIPHVKELRDEVLKRRAEITDNWRYTHVYKNVKK